MFAHEAVVDGAWRDLTRKVRVGGLEERAGRRFVGVPPGLQQAINHHYASRDVAANADRTTRKREHKAARDLAALNSVGVDGRER